MGVIIFYDLFKIIYNAVRIVFLKKEIKKFLKMDLIFGVICFFEWANLVGNALVFVPSQIFHSISYYFAILIFSLDKKQKKFYNYLLTIIITIDITVVLIIFSLLELYFITVIGIVICIFTIIILRKNKDKLKDLVYLALALLDIVNIFISYIVFIAYAASAF